MIALVTDEATGADTPLGCALRPEDKPYGCALTGSQEPARSSVMARRVPTTPRTTTAA